MVKSKTFKKIIFNSLSVWLAMFLFLPLPVSTPLQAGEKSFPFVENYEHHETLQADADALLSLFDAMPKVPVFLTDEPVSKTGTSIESGVAYTQCATDEKPTIFVKKDFYEKTNRKQLINILKHELTHAWLCRQNLMSGHDERFRRKFSEVGGFGN